MKQSLRTVLLRTAIPQEVNEIAEKLEPHVEAQVFFVLRHLSQGQGAILTGEKSQALKLTLKKLAKSCNRKIVVRDCAHPHGLDDQQASVRLWLADEVADEAPKTRGRRRGKRKLSFVEWDDGELGEEARTADAESGADREMGYDIEQSMDRHYAEYLKNA